MARYEGSKSLIFANVPLEVLITAAWQELTGLTTAQRVGATIAIRAFRRSKALNWGNRLKRVWTAAMASIDENDSAAARHDANTGARLAVQALKLVRARLDNELSTTALRVALEKGFWLDKNGNTPAGAIKAIQEEMGSDWASLNRERRARISYSLSVVGLYNRTSAVNAAS